MPIGELHINEGVVGSIGSKHQVANRFYCLIHNELDGKGKFPAGDHCNQCGVHTSNRKYGELHIPTSPDFSCQCYPTISEDAIKAIGGTIFWEPDYPNQSCHDSLP